MHYLLQSNLSTEEGLQPFIDALTYLCAKRPTATWSSVKLVPFAGTIEPESEARRAGKVFPLGSCSMLAASRLYNWTPGVVFDPLTFRFEAWRDHWGAANLINGDAVVCRFGDAKANGQPVFMRPCEDLKTFTGLVVQPDELEKWQVRVWEGQQFSDAPELTLQTPVVVAPAKEILCEWRLFVVAGQIVASSQYAILGKRERSPNVPPEVLDFGRQMVDRWQPAACFVLDIGETADGIAIMEVNTLNSSGIYECDFRAVVEALEDHYEA